MQKNLYIKRKALPVEEKKARKTKYHSKYLKENSKIYPRRKWTKEEEDIIMNFEIPDKYISRIIERSIDSIAAHRKKLKNQIKVENSHEN